MSSPLVATAAASVVLGLAGKDGGAPVDGHGGHRAVIETIVKSVNLVRESLRDECILCLLGGGKCLHVHLLTKLRNLVVLLVNLVLTHLVEDSLRVGVLIGQHVADSIGDSGAVCACLTGDIGPKVGKAEAVLTAIIRELLRQTEHLLHVGHLTCVGSLLNTGEPVCKGHLDIRTAVTELGRKIAEVGLDSIQRHYSVLVGETLSCQLRLIEPRIKHVTTCISVAAEATVAVAPAEQDEQQQNPNLLP